MSEQNIYARKYVFALASIRGLTVHGVLRANINILDKLTRAGFEVAIVGGAVRDILAKKPVQDWDLTTDAKPEQILKLFANSFYNNRFGTVGASKKPETSRSDNYLPC